MTEYYFPSQLMGGKGVLHIAFYSDAQLQQFAGLLGQYDPEQAAEAADPSGEDEA